MISTLEIILYVLIATLTIFYIVNSIYKMKTGKSLLKRKKKENDEEE